MRQVVIARSGVSVSRIAFGTASLHHLFRQRERANLLGAAAGAGITHFDTAPFYGYGLAESDLGAFLRGRRTDFTVTTKVGLYPRLHCSTHASTVWARKLLGRLVPQYSLPRVNWSLARAQTSLEESLLRLDTDYVDFLMLHEPDFSLIRTDEFLRWIESEVARGNVRFWGVAGIEKQVGPFVSANHPLANVVQTRDSLGTREAEFVLAAGRPLQFTYGYLSSVERPGATVDPEHAMRAALRRNVSGSVIVSTRRADRIAQLARAAT